MYLYILERKGSWLGRIEYRKDTLGFFFFLSLIHLIIPIVCGD